MREGVNALIDVRTGGPRRAIAKDLAARNPKRFSKGGGGHMVGTEINLEVRSNLDAWPQ
jgi:hypothetical protein